MEAFLMHRNGGRKNQELQELYKKSNRYIVRLAGGQSVYSDEGPREQSTEPEYKGELQEMIQDQFVPGVGYEKMEYKVRFHCPEAVESKQAGFVHLKWNYLNQSSYTVNQSDEGAINCVDIRSYFSKTPESKSSTIKTSENGSSKVKKSRKRVFIDSDSEEESSTPKAEQKGKISNKKKKSEVNETSKYFEVTKNEVANIFGKGPIRRVEQPKIIKKDTIKAELEDIDWEDDFALAETAALAEKANGSLSSPQEDSPTIKSKKPLSADETSPKKRINKDASPQKITKKDDSPVKKTKKDDSPVKKTKKDALPKKNTKKDISPKKIKGNESPKKHLSKADESLKQSVETKEKEKPIQIISRDHEMSPSPERDVEPVSPILQKSSKKEKQNVLKNDPKGQESGLNGTNKTSASLKNSPKLKTKMNENKEKIAENKTINIVREAKKEDETCMLWVDKYKPSNLKQIIGQQGEKSNVNKLVKWLKSWYSNHGGSKKIPRPSPWAKDDSGAYFKAALLSGPPGVGKTTTAHLVCKELGMDFVEFNASDTRSKKLLKEEISDLLKSKSLSAFSTGGEGVSREHVLVMDEVDGMAGNEDRGGVQELIQLIKSSRVPIICMCNDRNHPKIRSLANYCFDLRFSKPRAEQIKGAMLSVCFKEGLKIKPEVLNDIIVNTNQDIRLILNHLSILAAQSNTTMPSASKYVKLGPWDVARKVFSEQDHKTMSIFDKCDLFFYDYNIAPLFVQENYLNVQPHSEASKTKRGKMELFAKAASSIACGDLVEKAIRSCNAWSLLPVQAVFSSYMPGEYLVGHMGGQINFPAWLGKNSRQGKIDRMCQEIQAHTRLKVSGGKEAVKLDYGNALKEKIVRPLVEHGVDGVEDSLNFLKEYSLLREDLDSLSEITTWPNQIDSFSKLESKVKSAFTRAYNKNPVVTPFSISAPVKKGRGGAGEGDLGEEDLEEMEEEEEEDQDDISKDGMIMAPKKKTGREESKKGESSVNSKRGGGRGKRGKK